METIKSDVRNVKIYAASRASVPERVAMWLALRRAGVDITSSWIYEADPGENDFPIL